MREELGIPSGQKHELCRGAHAEQNAVIQAARYGVSIDGATVYCTNQPCIVCAKILINAGVEKIIYENSYPDELSEQMIKEAGIELVHMPAKE